MWFFFLFVCRRGLFLVDVGEMRELHFHDLT